MSIKQKLFNVIDNYKDKNILVVGDIILDEYIWGKATRLSPEAPVPVLEVSKYSYILGGSANVAHNIAVLGGKTVLIGVAGNDMQSDLLCNELQKANIDAGFIVKDSSRPTTVKTRLIAHNHQQLARADREMKTPINADIEAKILLNITKVIENTDLVILSDYAKGVLSETSTSKIIELVKSYEKPIIVDPKGIDYSKYSGVDLITPNRLEAEVATKSQAGANPEEMAIKLFESLNIKHVLVTLGEDGILLYSGNEFKKLPAVTSEVYDVTGAGDSLISALAISMVASGYDVESSVMLGNYSAGVAVRRTGTTVVSTSELKSLIEHHMLNEGVHCFS